MTTQPKELVMGRKIKSAAERAQEVLGVAERRVAKLNKARDLALDALRQIEWDLSVAEKRLVYVSQDPALPKPAVKAVS